MTSRFHTSLMAKTAPCSGAAFGVRGGRVGRPSLGTEGFAGVRATIVEASNDIHALAARSAG